MKPVQSGAGVRCLSLPLGGRRVDGNIGPSIRSSGPRPGKSALARDDLPDRGDCAVHLLERVVKVR